MIRCAACLARAHAARPCGRRAAFIAVQPHRTKDCAQTREQRRQWRLRHRRRVRRVQLCQRGLAYLNVRLQQLRSRHVQEHRSAVSSREVRRVALMSWPLCSARLASAHDWQSVHTLYAAPGALAVRVQPARECALHSGLWVIMLQCVARRVTGNLFIHVDMDNVLEQHKPVHEAPQALQRDHLCVNGVRACAVERAGAYRGRHLALAFAHSVQCCLHTVLRRACLREVGLCDACRSTRCLGALGHVRLQVGVICHKHATCTA